MFQKILIIPFLLVFALKAQNLEKAPKLKALEVGVKYMHSKNDQGYGLINTFAPTAQFSLGWQLTGYQKKRKTYISVPMGYTYSDQGSVLNYGWKLTHDLLRNRNTTPYLAYNLQLNQIFLPNQTNRRIGHETASEIGLRLKDKSKLRYIASLTYGRSTFPNFTEEEPYGLSSMALKIGIGF